MLGTQFVQDLRAGKIDKFGSMLVCQNSTVTEEESNNPEVAIRKNSLPVSQIVEKLKSVVKTEDVIKAGIHIATKYPIQTCGTYTCLLPDPVTKKIGPQEIEREYAIRVELYKPEDVAFRRAISRSPVFDYEGLPILDENTDPTTFKLPIDTTAEEFPTVFWKFKVPGIDKIFLGSVYYHSLATPG